MDVGCGQGTITVGFGQELSAGTVAGFDTQVEHIEQATQLAQTEGVTNVTFRVGDLFQPPFPKASFDIAFANAVISHQANPEGGIVAMKNLVKAGGLVGEYPPKTVFDTTEPAVRRSSSGSRAGQTF